MKKVVVVAVAAVFALVLAGCAASSSSSSAASTSASATSASAAASSAAASTSASASAAAASASAPAAASSAAAQSASSVATSPSAAAASPSAAAPSSEAAASSAAAGDGQAPIMNFVGPYMADRARLMVEAAGGDQGKITIEWASSASENTVWNITGTFNPDTLTLNYDKGTKTTTKYKSDGTVESETVEYTDGVGRFKFHTDNTVTWEDEKENAGDGLTFKFNAQA